MKFEKLFTPGRIGRLELKNRVVMPPMGTDFANHDGTASERLIRYYEERARGGAALIINEYTCVDDENSVSTNYNLRISRDWHIQSCEQLVEAVHRHGAIIFAQLHHGGSTSKPALSGRVSLSASDVPAVPGAPTPRAMTTEETEDAVRKFTAAAVRCKKAGYDGVELHGAHSYLIGQFFSPYYNKRTDKYGGSFENRMKFIDEIIVAIRGELGANYPISVRICGDEMTPNVPDTLTLGDGLRIGKHLESMGIDVINISNGSALNANANCDPYSYEPGWKKHVAHAFKEELSIPVIATNTIKDPAFAEKLLEEGVCDFVALGRAHFADPDFVRKTKVGRESEIRTCIGCMYCRERLLVHCNSVACAVNPRMGREHILGGLKWDGERRNVVVTGGGPAGMEAAITLARRNFRVTLFEREGELGGTLNIADKLPHKELITRLVRGMESELNALGAQVKLGCAATEETVRPINPIAVFAATGAEPIIPDIPGVSEDGVKTAEGVIKGASVGKNVLVVGTGLTGLETGLMLAERGCAVTFAEMADEAGKGIFAVIRNDVMERLNKRDVKFLTGYRLTSVQKSDGCLLVTLTKGDGSEVIERADTVVIAIGAKPRPDAPRSFDDIPVFTIGDAAKSGRIADAIGTAFDAAYSFAPDF